MRECTPVVTYGSARFAVVPSAVGFQRNVRFKHCASVSVRNGPERRNMSLCVYVPVDQN